MTDIAARAPSLTVWFRSRLFRSYLRAFILLWLVAKIAMIVGAVLYRAPLFAFHPFGEAVACAIELGLIALFVRGSHEDILLANLGWPLGTALAPLALVHLVLSLLVTLLG